MHAKLAIALFLSMFVTVAPSRVARADPPADARESARHAERLVAVMDGTAEHVRTALRRARAHRPARAHAVACLDEALSRVDTALRAARDEARAAGDAALAGDSMQARSHAARVTRLREMSRAAAAEGDACAGAPELAQFEEGTRVRVIIDPAIAPVAP